MNKLWIITFCIALVIPVFSISCASSVSTAGPISISCDDFQNQASITKDVQLITGNTLTVALCSNRTTGFSWSEKAQISNPQVVEQTGYKWVSPEDTGKVGVPGTEEFMFKALQPGNSVITFGYSRPWEGGEKNMQTVILNVTVK